jgi:hypothetical protein
MPLHSGASASSRRGGGAFPGSSGLFFLPHLAELLAVARKGVKAFFVHRCWLCVRAMGGVGWGRRCGVILCPFLSRGDGACVGCTPRRLVCACVRAVSRDDRTCLPPQLFHFQPLSLPKKRLTFFLSVLHRRPHSDDRRSRRPRNCARTSADRLTTSQPRSKSTCPPQPHNPTPPQPEPIFSICLTSPPRTPFDHACSFFFPPASNPPHPPFSPPSPPSPRTTKTTGAWMTACG